MMYGYYSSPPILSSPWISLRDYGSLSSNRIGSRDSLRMRSTPIPSECKATWKTATLLRHAHGPPPAPAKSLNPPTDYPLLTFVIFRPRPSLGTYLHCAFSSLHTSRSIDLGTMKRATRVLPSITPVSPLLPHTVQLPAWSFSPCLFRSPISSLSQSLATRFYSIGRSQYPD